MGHLKKTLEFPFQPKRLSPLFRGLAVLALAAVSGRNGLPWVGGWIYHRKKWMEFPSKSWKWRWEISDVPQGFFQKSPKLPLKKFTASEGPLIVLEGKYEINCSWNLSNRFYVLGDSCVKGNLIDYRFTSLLAASCLSPSQQPGWFIWWIHPDIQPNLIRII